MKWEWAAITQQLRSLFLRQKAPARSARLERGRFFAPCIGI